MGDQNLFILWLLWVVNSDQIAFLFYSRTLDVPVIGALRGPAIGAGACLAIAGCDLRVAERSTKMAFNFLKIGLHPGENFNYVLFVSFLN